MKNGISFPMEDAGKRSFPHLLHRNSATNAIQAQLVCCFADTEQGYPFGSGKAVAGKGLDGKFLSVVLAYHLSAGDAALHRIVLFVEFKHSR